MATVTSKSSPRPHRPTADNPSPESFHRGDAVDLPAVGFIRLSKVLSLVPVSASGWWAGIQAGRFPKGVKISPRVTAWSVESIRELIASLSATEEVGHE